MKCSSLFSSAILLIGIATAFGQEIPEDDPRGYYIETDSDWPGVEKLHFSFGDINYRLSTVTGFAALPGEDAGFAGSCWIDFDLSPNTYRCQINYDASGTVLKLRLTPPWQWQEGRRIGEAEINDNGDVSAIRVSRLEERILRGAPGPQGEVGPRGPAGPTGATGGGGTNTGGGNNPSGGCRVTGSITIDPPNIIGTVWFRGQTSGCPTSTRVDCDLYQGSTLVDSESTFTSATGSFEDFTDTRPTRAVCVANS